MQRIVVPTLRFPPLGGVGLRRIMKITKYLAGAGNEIHYITTHNVRQKNTYEKDIPSENAYISRIPSLSLYNILQKPSSNLIFILFRRVLNRLLCPLYFIDYALLWGFILIPYMLLYMRKHTIKKIYCSGPPFSTVLHCAMIKWLLGDKITLISDWRDLWVEDYYRSYPFPKTFFRYLNKKAEKFCLSHSDWIIAVTPQLGTILKGKDIDSKKIIILENGFDPDDFQEKSYQPLAEGKLRLVYTGSVSGTRFDGLLLLLDALEMAVAEGHAIELEIVGEINNGDILRQRYFRLIEQKVLQFSDLCSPAEAVEKLYGADYGVVLVQREHPEALTSKFFDYCALGKTILGIGPKGELEEKINQHGIGYYVGMDDKDAVERIAAIIQERSFAKPENFNNIKEQNNYKSIAQNIAKLFTESI